MFSKPPYHSKIIKNKPKYNTLAIVKFENLLTRHFKIISNGIWYITYFWGIETPNSKRVLSATIVAVICLDLFLCGNSRRNVFGFLKMFSSQSTLTSKQLSPQHIVLHPSSNVAIISVIVTPVCNSPVFAERLGLSNTEPL